MSPCQYKKQARPINKNFGVILKNTKKMPIYYNCDEMNVHYSILEYLIIFFAYRVLHECRFAIFQLVPI